MDADRKSTVSSFYGGRKQSIDALNTEYPPQPSIRGRDDSSSFFLPDRSSMDPLNSVPRSSAGYNRGSFFHAGREEPLKGGRDEEREDAWDVYADFNNAGPRYSSAFGMGQNSVGYSQIRSPVPLQKEEALDPEGKVEMVTVPALGAEWGKDEMHQMTKAGKSERKKESRAQCWKSWNRGERGICGRYFTRKVLVFSLFGLCCAIAIVLGFTIPRVPSITFNKATPLVNATGPFATSIPIRFSRAPANFSFPAFASLQVDTSSNFLPLHFTRLRATVYDLDSNLQVGSGSYAHQSLPAQSFPAIRLPLNFTYVTSNTSDQTWTNWYQACRNRQFYTGGVRPSLKFRLVLDMVIQGLPGHRSTSAQVSDADCPVELPTNAA